MAKQINMAFRSEMEKIFLKRTGNIYHSLKKRLTEKRDRKNRLIRRGRELPFTLDEFRSHLRSQFSEEWEATCSYCPKRVTPANFQAEHSVPLSRGGSLNLNNIVLSCDDDNRIKGKMLPDEFSALMRGLATFPEPARNDILGRLRGQMKFLRPKSKPEVNVVNTAS